MSNTKNIFDRIMEDNLDEIKLLIENGADIESKNDSGKTPLQLAAFIKNLDAMKLLIEKGADIESKDSDTGQTSLHEATLLRRLNVMKLLIEKGADIESKNSIGQTPLHIATSSSGLDAMKLLIEKGADIESKNRIRKTPLYEITESYRLNPNSDKLDIMSLLIRKGADMNGINSSFSQIIESLKVCKTEKENLAGSLTDIVEKLKVCNSRPRNTNVNKDIPSMNNFISDQISKMSSHDVMVNEEVNVGDFLNDDEDNIVFVIDGKFSTIINKQFINLEDPTSLFYECIEANSAFFQNNNITGPKLFLLKKIGGMQGGLVWLEDLEKIKEDSTKNAFVLEKVKRIETLVSMDVIDNQNLVGGTHCQPGLNDTVYKVSFGIHIGDPIVPIIPGTEPTREERLEQIRVENEEQVARERERVRQERLERIRVENEERVERERERVQEEQVERERERVRVERERVERERERIAAQSERAARIAQAEQAAQEVSTQDEINQRRIVRGRRVPAIR